jgi:hypothetical protein
MTVAQPSRAAEPLYMEGADLSALSNAVTCRRRPVQQLLRASVTTAASAIELILFF